MFKQAYKFLSVVLISNLLFSPAVLSKTQNDPNTCCHKKSIMHRLFCHKKPAEQKPNNQQTNNQQPNNNQVQKPTYPTYDEPGGYVTKYGVYFNDDIYDTYPPQNPNK